MRQTSLENVHLSLIRANRVTPRNRQVEGSQDDFCLLHGTNRSLFGGRLSESMVLERPKERAMTAAVQHDFLVRLGEREQIAERTIACRLEKPLDFVFKPGQFVEITFLNPPETDDEGNSRTFSIAS